ncbi:C40 family peptidase [Streptomyces atriruber]|uniref:C40 family peptidase n=1 Tax=Streptomyces atriruber TaxID=545121 RepID=UPI000B25AC20|nr:C40 family peptidase [Streptomyces atriruber]
MQTPRFTEEIPADCGCGHCTGAPVPGGAGQRRCGSVRGAVAAAVGAAVLVGAAAGTASAEPAPSRAGWDGSKYWYKDATGWWRWTSHYDKYVARGGKGAAASHAKGKGASAGARRSTSSEPVFRGRQGWDATDRVYWYRKAGHWYWTSHQYKYERYTGRSAKPAAKPATKPATKPAPKPSTGSGTPSRHGTEAAIAFAMRHLGDPYVWGGNGPHGWDCSGLVLAAYRQAGVALPRVADAQYRATQPISRGELRRGDLVFWSSNGSSSGIHHVAIYLGGGQYLEAPRPGKNVRVSSFSWYNPNMYGRVR